MNKNVNKNKIVLLGMIVCASAFLAQAVDQASTSFFSRLRQHAEKLLVSAQHYLRSADKIDKALASDNPARYERIAKTHAATMRIEAQDLLYDAQELQHAVQTTSLAFRHEEGYQIIEKIIHHADDIIKIANDALRRAHELETAPAAARKQLLQSYARDARTEAIREIQDGQKLKDDVQTLVLDCTSSHSDVKIIA